MFNLNFIPLALAMLGFNLNLKGNINESGRLFSIVAYSDTEPKNLTESMKSTKVGSSN